MAMLDREGVSIYYEVHGSGPAIILSHGFSATSQMWKPQIDALSRAHTLITWDFRGHGQSDAPDDLSRYSEALTTADIAALLDVTGFESAVVGGLSLGGYMSLAFHVDYPERVRALLIIDTGPGFRNDASREAWNRTSEASARNIEKNGIDPGGSAERVGARHNDIMGVVRAGLTMLKQHNARVIESLPGIAVPSLVVVGALDEPFIAGSNYMAAKIPGAEKLVIDGAGHASNLDQPDAFNAGILSFLDRHGL